VARRAVAKGREAVIRAPAIPMPCSPASSARS
jgi:hypothetical protein